MKCVSGKLGLVMLVLTFLGRPNASHAGIIVNANENAVYSGIAASPGQIFDITATGQVNISDLNGGYITDANGTLLIARRSAPVLTTSSPLSPRPGPQRSVKRKTSILHEAMVSANWPAAPTLD